MIIVTLTLLFFFMAESDWKSGATKVEGSKFFWWLVSYFFASEKRPDDFAYTNRSPVGIKEHIVSPIGYY